MYRVKCLQYNWRGQLEETDVGSIPADLFEVYGARTFTFNDGEQTFRNCYVEREELDQPLGWRLLGYAFIVAVIAIAGLAALVLLMP